MDNGVQLFLAAAARDSGSQDGVISDQELEQILTAAVQLYARRSESTGTYPPAVSKNAVVTDVLTTVCEMLRVVDVNMFDLSMWFERRK